MDKLNIFGKIFSKRSVDKKKSVEKKGASRRLIEVAQLMAKDALDFLNTTTAGLAFEDVENRRERYGKNEVAYEKPPAWYVQFLHAFITPFNGILFFVATISCFTDIIFAAPEDRTYKTVIVLSTMIFLSTVLRFWQEFRSNQAAQKLKAMIRTTAAVLRQAQAQPYEIHVEELVPGDIVYLSAGDMIPADLRILTSKDLFISQAVLTGESIPVEKYDILKKAIINPDPTLKPSKAYPVANPLELENLCFMGTNVVSGSATGVIINIGQETYFGSMAKELTGKRPLTSFDKGINRVSGILVRFMMVMVPIVFLINGLDKGDWLQALLFAVAVAVGLTPEMLPMIVTTNLARGAVAMSKRKTIVKRLNSIQNFGAMNILCTDKTGTLTQDKIILEYHLDIFGSEDSQVLEFAWLNSFHQTGLKNLLDVAVLNHSKSQTLLDKLKAYKKIDEMPFDFVRRRMSLVVKNDQQQHLLICKGATEEVLALCDHVDDNGAKEGGIVPFTDQMRQDVHAVTYRLNEDGLRVLAVAYKIMPAENRAYTVADEKNMVLAGYIAFLDPPKETAREAIEALEIHGVKVKIITGDNEVVTRKICKEVGISIEHILLGHEIEALSDQELAEKAEIITVFAKTSPMQKSRIIRALQSRDHVVGYMGDGINDAAAIRDADVGISVDTGVDIAKESADIILLEKNLRVLEEGVIEGRKTFANIIKYIKMTASSNFGNVFSVLVASAFLPFLPMLAIHLLIQNLFYDISQISIPWDRVDADYLEKPRKWEAGGVARFMIFIGPISSIFDITTFCLMWFVFKANNPAVQSLFQSGWFIEGLLSQTLIVHMIRTEKIPFFQSMPAMPVVTLTMTIMIAGIAFIYTPFSKEVGLEALPLSYFPWLVLTLLSYCVLTQIMKRWYIRRFHQWL